MRTTAIGDRLKEVTLVKGQQVIPRKMPNVLLERRLSLTSRVPKFVTKPVKSKKSFSLLSYGSAYDVDQGAVIRGRLIREYAPVKVKRKTLDYKLTKIGGKFEYDKKLMSPVPARMLRSKKASVSELLVEQPTTVIKTPKNILTEDVSIKLRTRQPKVSYTPPGFRFGKGTNLSGMLAINTAFSSINLKTYSRTDKLQYPIVDVGQKPASRTSVIPKVDIRQKPQQSIVYVGSLISESTSITVPRTPIPIISVPPPSPPPPSLFGGGFLPPSGLVLGSGYGRGRKQKRPTQYQFSLGANIFGIKTKQKSIANQLLTGLEVRPIIGY